MGERSAAGLSPATAKTGLPVLPQADQAAMPLWSAFVQHQTFARIERVPRRIVTAVSAPHFLALFDLRRAFHGWMKE
ncbi:hypothetical protein, partial [Brucella haematophila]|uniref:hypothetical protein n=1 Tax=Brucella haematophila TaxID=419474 RepID=UPI0035BBE020